jgi:hypothetical protein
MKTYAFLLSLVISSQLIAQPNFSAIQQGEDSLQYYAIKILQGRDAKERYTSDSIFTRLFVKALKNPYSFYYPFDSLYTISKLYAPDSSFRIYTWQLVISENFARQHGAIQMRTTDGSLKLYPLIDKSDVIVAAADTITNHKSWMGAVYYKIIQKRSVNQNYYTLLGFDENNIRSHRKYIDVLIFNGDEPVFGDRNISFEQDGRPAPSVSRYIMEFKKNAGARLAYDAEMDMIIAEHLESENQQPQKKWTYVPDGDYEGFKWQNGKWIHVEKVFNQVRAEGDVPMPSPVKENQGKAMEELLQSQQAPDEQPETPATPRKKPVSKKKGKG